MAAQSCGRVCYAVEIDPIYVDVAIRRWQAFTGEVALRERDGRAFDDVHAERHEANAPAEDLDQAEETQS